MSLLSSLSPLTAPQQEELSRLRERPSDLLGQVLWGANNIFCVACEDGRERQCRLRGKTLSHQGLEQEHNPLICGDFVLLESSSHSEGQIYRRLERRNALRRRNLKRGEPQAFAANIDGVILMVSWNFPPLRPAFLDRLLIAARQSQSEIVLLLNKLDCITSLRQLGQLRRFVRQYRRLGLDGWPISLQGLQYNPDDSHDSQTEKLNPDGVPGRKPLMRTILNLLAKLENLLLRFWLHSFAIPKGRARLQHLYQRLGDRLYAVLGASGVGKSSLCNYLFPQQRQEIRAISEKWQRGVHTTTLARTLIQQQGERCHRLIDTPGMRNFLPAIAEAELPQLQDSFPEFASPRKLCAYNACLHRYEPDCGVRDAAEYGLISEQRYLSYLNLYQDLEASFRAMPGYQTQGKIQGKSSSENAKDSSRNNPSKNKDKSKGKGQRGDSSQSRLKERKKDRSKLQLHNDEQGSYDCEDF